MSPVSNRIGEGKRVRKSNPNLSALRRRKIQFFTKQTLENQALGYGAPGSDSWINGVVKFLDARTITANVVTRWLDHEPSLIEASPNRVVTRLRSDTPIKPSSRHGDILKAIRKAPSYEPRYPPSWYNFFKSDTASPANQQMELETDDQQIQPDDQQIQPDDQQIQPDNEQIQPDNQQIQPDNQQIQPDDEQMLLEHLHQHAFLHANIEDVNQALGPEDVHLNAPGLLHINLLRTCYDDNPVLAYDMLRNLEELFNHILNVVELVNTVASNSGVGPQEN